jgi:hypothetical protein
LAVIIDSETYSALKTEISQYAKDVKKDSGYKVQVKTFSKDEGIETIKEYLKNLYFTENLKIAVLVGEVPTADYYPGTTSMVSVPSDSYYYDVYGKCPKIEKIPCQNSQCPVVNDIVAFDARNNFCDPKVIPFVLSRITPPVKGQEGIQLLKNYFNNNHDFRTGKFSFNQKALLYLPLFNDAENPQYPLGSLEENLQMLLGFKQLKTFDKKDLFFADWNNTTENPRPKANFLAELSKYYQYVYIGAHGSPDYHDFDITSASLKNPNAFYLDFYSCNVGKFTNDNYIAGNYLLNGKSMFVNAASDTLFSPIGILNSYELFLLKQGKPISDILETAIDPNYIIQHFGDPTLKSPQGEFQKNSLAEICLKQNEIDFGEIKVCKNITNYKDCEDSSGVKDINFSFSNSGTEDLAFMADVKPIYSLDTIKNSNPMQGYDLPYRISFDVGETGGVPSGGGGTTSIAAMQNPYLVKQGETKTIGIKIIGLVAGTYTGKIIIYNNDPKNPMFEVPFKVTITE